MSDLQISLIGIGIVVVAGVILFNWMQQRRYRKGAEEAFERKHEDVLLGTDEITDEITNEIIAEDGRVEPQLGREMLQEFQAEPSTGFAEPSIEAIKPVEISPPDSAARVVTAAPAVQRTTGVNGASASAVDYIVSIQAEGLIAASSLIEVLQRKFDFSKPVHWLGQRDADTSWEEITLEAGISGGGYISLRGCLQLSDRSGPVSEVSLSEFCDMAQNFAVHVHAVADFPDIRQAHAQAVLLDQFCAEVDVMISVNIISKDGGAFTGTKIRALAEASGFKLETGGAFNCRDESGAVLFSLNNYESTPFLPDIMRTLTTHGVTFLLDVPRVKNGERVFDQMMHLAGIFSTTLGGTLVDDNRVSLSESGIGKIRQHLGGIQAKMKAHNIPAGSEIALRLFA